MKSREKQIYAHIKLAAMEVTQALGVGARDIGDLIVPALTKLAVKCFEEGKEFVSEKRRWDRVKLRDPDEDDTDTDPFIRSRPKP